MLKLSSFLSDPFWLRPLNHQLSSLAPTRNNQDCIFEFPNVLGKMKKLEIKGHEKMKKLENTRGREDKEDEKPRRSCPFEKEDASTGRSGCTLKK